MFVKYRACAGADGPALVLSCEIIIFSKSSRATSRSPKLSFIAPKRYLEPISSGEISKVYAISSEDFP